VVCPDIVTDIKKKSLEWNGHVERMDQGRTVKKILERKLVGTRRRGRPVLRCVEDVQKDLWKTKVKRWQQKAVKREERAPLIKKVKLSDGLKAKEGGSE